MTVIKLINELITTVMVDDSDINMTTTEVLLCAEHSDYDHIKCVKLTKLCVDDKDKTFIRIGGKYA